MSNRPDPIPLFVLTGFLGAGKTTLLNRLLHDPAMAGTAVIINEFGSVGLDHLFVEVKDQNMVLLSSGCLCCTVRGELVSTLEDLLRDRDNNRIPPFSRVVIETTGLADPAPVLQSVLGHPYLSLRYRLQGVMTLVDAVNGMATLDAHQEAVKQAAIADVLVLTKGDLMLDQPDQLTALRHRLAALNPYASCLDAAKGEATPAALLGLGGFVTVEKRAEVADWIKDSHSDHHHDHHHDHHDHHHHGHHHHHDPDRHDAHIRAFSLVSDRAIAPSALDLFIDLLRSAHGANLLRLKGLVKLSDQPDQPILLHGVQHVFHPPERLPHWPDADHRTRLVFITRDLDEAFVQGLWKALLGEPQIDRPDAAALADNPLSLRR
jgi:G3E family GTPase